MQEPILYIIDILLLYYFCIIGQVQDKDKTHVVHWGHLSQFFPSPLCFQTSNSTFNFLLSPAFGPTMYLKARITFSICIKLPSKAAPTFKVHYSLLISMYFMFESVERACINHFHQYDERTAQRSKLNYIIQIL